MHCNRGIPVLLQVRPQGGVLLGGDGLAPARRNSCGEGIRRIPAATSEEPLNRGQAHPKRGCRFRAWHPTLNRGNDALA
jgi:hypothetical protein